MAQYIDKTYIGKTAPNNRHVLWIDISRPMPVMKSYLNGKWSQVSSAQCTEIVDTQEYPTLQDFLASEGEIGVIYLYPNGDQTTQNRYKEYIWVNDTIGYELIDEITIDISGKADKVNGATAGNFAGVDSNGNLIDSGHKHSDYASASQGSKADTAIQSVTVGTTTTGAAGTNASVANSGTATNPVFDFTIPRGADGIDAVNPFKGWYSSAASLPANPVVGDYAYVKGAESTDPVAIYECATAGTWSDSGRTADTSNVQTFASGEEVNETYIDDTYLVNPKDGALPTAEAVIQLKAKLQNSTASEVKATFTSNYGYVAGRDGVVVTSQTTKYADISIPSGAKRVRFAAPEYEGSKSVGYVFLNADGVVLRHTANFYKINTGVTTRVSDYVIDVPDNAAYFRTNVMLDDMPESAFYCYFQFGDNTSDLDETSIGKLSDKILVVGKNLLNRNWINAYYINASGGTVLGTSSYKCMFIPCKPNTNYYFSSGATSNLGTTNTHLVIYNSDGTVTDKGALNKLNLAFTTGANAITIGVSITITTLATMQLEEGSSRTSYEAPFTPYYQYKLNNTDSLLAQIDLVKSGGVNDNSIGISKVSFAHSKNLIDLTDPTYQEGYVLRTSGITEIYSTYNTTPYVKIESGVNYTWSDGGTDVNANKIRVICYYNENKQYIANTYTEYPSQPITPPQGASYLRISWFATGTKPQLEVGTKATEYTPYKVVIDDDVLPSIISNDHTSAFVDNGTLEQNEYLLLANQHINKNTCVVAEIDGVVESVLVGLGYVSSSTYYYRDYAASWVEITSTQVKLYRAYNATPILRNTYNHGLSLSDKIWVSIDKTQNKDGSLNIILRIVTNKGSVYTQTLPEWGMGRPFVQNQGSSTLGVKLSFMAKDIDSPVWVFSDSMASYWRPVIDSMGFDGYLSNDQPGMQPSTGVANLRTLLAHGRPTTVIWLLGANGSTGESKVDGQYVISQTQKQSLDAIMSICEYNNIDLILTALPTWPTRQRIGFTNYVKSTGLRYIDLQNAVESDEYGIWHSSPTLKAWSGAYGIIYSQWKANEGTLGNGDPLFDINGDIINDASITEVSGNTITATINGNSYQFTRDTTNDIIGLVSSDGLHPTSEGGRVYANTMLVDAPELTIIN